MINYTINSNLNVPIYYYENSNVTLKICYCKMSICVIALIIQYIFAFNVLNLPISICQILANSVLSCSNTLCFLLHFSLII